MKYPSNIVNDLKKRIQQYGGYAPPSVLKQWMEDYQDNPYSISKTQTTPTTTQIKGQSDFLNRWYTGEVQKASDRAKSQASTLEAQIKKEYSASVDTSKLKSLQSQLNSYKSLFDKQKEYKTIIDTANRVWSSMKMVGGSGKVSQSDLNTLKSYGFSSGTDLKSWASEIQKDYDNWLKQNSSKEAEYNNTYKDYLQEQKNVAKATAEATAKTKAGLAAYNTGISKIENELLSSQTSLSKQTQAKKSAIVEELERRMELAEAEKEQRRERYRR